MYCGFITVVAFGLVIPSARLEQCQVSSDQCYQQVNAVLSNIPEQWIESGVVTAYNQRCHLIPRPRPTIKKETPRG